jgi:hypothetical protein
MDGDNAIAALATAIETRMVEGSMPWRMAAGATAPWASIAANSGASLTVTFPTSRFTSAPIMSTNGISSGYVATSSAAPNTTQCTLRCYNPTGGSITPSVHWMAIQMLPGSGAGLLAVRELEPGETAYRVTCHTAGCDNADAELEIFWLDADGDPTVVCGVCGQPITDVIAA